MSDLHYGPPVWTVWRGGLIKVKPGYGRSQHAGSLSNSGDELGQIAIADRGLKIEFSDRIAQVGFLNGTGHGSDGNRLRN